MRSRASGLLLCLLLAGASRAFAQAPESVFLVLAIDPRMVRTGHLPPGAGRRDGDGVDGDPSRSSAELGRLGVEAIVAQTVEAVRKSVARR